MFSLRCHIFSFFGLTSSEARKAVAMMTDDDHKPGSPPGADRGVYGISVAAELSGINEQSLRLYERQGLLTPARSKGGTRRYSADDLIRLQRISELSAAVVNLAGIARIIELEDRNDFLDERNAALEDDNAAPDTAKTRRKSAGRRLHP